MFLFFQLQRDIVIVLYEPFWVAINWICAEYYLYSC